MPLTLRRRVTRKNRLFSLAIAAGLGAVSATTIMLRTSLPDFVFQVACGVALMAIFALWHAIFHADLLWVIDEERIRFTRKTALGGRMRQWPTQDIATLRARTIAGDEWPDTHYVEIRLRSGPRLKLPTYRRRARTDEIIADIEALTSGR